MYARKQTNWVGITLGFLVTLLLAGVSAIAVWEYFQIKELKNEVETAKAATGSVKSDAFELRQNIDAMRAQMVLAQQESVPQTQTRVLQEIVSLRELPKNETPTIAQVSDITKLAEEPFFSNGENGDYIVVYKKANISILYRPAEKKIINSGTVKTEN